MSGRIVSLPEGRINHLQKKILFTLFFLAIYRIGVHIPIPGVDTFALGEFFRNQGSNLFGMFNMFSGGALQNFSILALGVVPYISSSIVMQMLTFAVPHFVALSKEGDAGRKKINQYTRYGTVVLAAFQGFMLAKTLENQDFAGSPLVITGGTGWIFLTALSVTAGTAFVMWLGEQITDRGVGNGISLIIFASIVSSLPSMVMNTYSDFTNQQLDLFKVLLMVVISTLITAGVVFMEQGARQISVQYAKRQVGRKVYGGQNSHLPIRINTAGVIPPIFASSVLNLPLTISAMTPNSGVADFLNTFFIPGGWLYNVVFVLLIVFFAFFYTGISFRADDVAENLKKHGGFIAGIRPGARTAEYLDKVLSRLTMVGAIYLSAICVLPTLLASKISVQFAFGGTSLLIVVGVALETFRQIDSHRQSLRYDSFLKGKTAIRPRRGT